ncbi:hypothetical protein MXB_1751 [Myxobolus squamalis]|nr:hypothetical protein MXB_1751 [Myxobolus squamalis]
MSLITPGSNYENIHFCKNWTTMLSKSNLSVKCHCPENYQGVNCNLHKPCHPCDKSSYQFTQA